MENKFKNGPEKTHRYGKVVFLPLDGDKPTGPVKDFATGWLKGSQASGRPMGLAVAPDGSLMVSDDKSGYIYRITYGK